MGKYNSINDAVRAKIDKLVEEKGLDKKDYLYTADVASSLNQLASIMGGSGDSMTIADSLYDVLDSAGSGGSGLDGYKLIDRSYSGENGEIVIPAGKISSIGYYGLAGTRATKIDLKDSGIKTINEGGLSGNLSLNEIVFPDDLRQIGSYCFTGCFNITDINWNSNVIVDLVSTFAGCTKLVNVPILTVPESKWSANNTFAGCTKLKKVIITNAKYLDATFGGCSSLEYVYLGQSVSTISAGAFGGVPVTCKVRCGFSEGAISGFPANGGWAGNPNDLDIEYDVPVPTEYPED